MIYERSSEYWKNKQAIIKNKKSENKKILIEIAAQHPLKNGKEPGEEFENRLLKGIELYKREIEKGNEVIFYIPGSIHYITKDGEKILKIIDGKILSNQVVIEEEPVVEEIIGEE